MEEFLFGACYYPEHWEKDRMEADIKKMQELGINTVRMGEFAWSRFEPEEGVYCFDFLREAVELCKKYGIYVILGTPTAAPPVWMSRKYPEILCADKNGYVMTHGSRQHHNHTSRVYLSFCEKITRRMALAFRDCDNVIGWQIDNEFNCHRDTSYSETDHAAFRKWLERKYGNIQVLNQSWGTVFWSLEFSSFEEITCPVRTATHQNPSWLLDFYRFTSDSVIEYCMVQAKVLREVTPDRFITHNGTFQYLDYHKLAKTALDFLSYDSYPAFSEQFGEGNSITAYYKLSHVRMCSEKYLILEQQSGPGGQMEYLLPTPEPGQIRLWTYQSISQGAAGILYFRWRTARFGAEQLWYGIYGHDDTENYRSREVREIGAELKRWGPFFAGHSASNQVAMYYGFDNKCNETIETFTRNDDWEMVSQLVKRHIPVDFVADFENLKKYKAVLLPHAYLLSEEQAAQLTAYVEQGGVLIVSCQSGTKDNNNHYYGTDAPGVLRELCGVTAAWFTAIPEYKEPMICFQGNRYPARQYLELLEPQTAQVEAVYEGKGIIQGKAAVTKNQVKDGCCYYIGSYLEREGADIYEALLRRHVTLPYADFPPLVQATDYQSHLLLLNFSGDPQKVPLRGVNLLDQSSFDGELAPYGVVFMEKETGI